jgi:hypothetical protein
MDATGLQQAILDSSGIRSINFFNGRLLTARDLTREQAANREVDGRLGQGVGDGIAYGLEVAKSTNQASVVYVTSGLAVNRLGRTLRLISDTEVELVRQPDSSTASKPFTECLPLQSGTYVAGAGAYLLTMAPAQTNEGKAPTNGLDSPAVTCNTDATVTTVQFRLIQLDPPITEAELDDEDHLRNLIAYKCFGVTEQQAYVKDLFGAELKKYGLLDSIRPTRLTDCDVPLAVLYWTLSGGIVFLDNWSVRRRLIHHLISGRHAPYLDETSTRASEAMAFASRVAPYVDERRAGEGLAMLLQFEEHLFTLAGSLPNPQNFVATSAFNLLPPAGVVPLRNTAHPLGFAYEKFFQDKSFAPPTPISGAKLGDLLAESLHYPPIDLSRAEYIQLYTVVENTQAQTGPTPPQPYIVFASQELPYYSEKPRFASLCQTLRETRAAYRDFIQKNVFLSNVRSAEGLTARLSVMAALQAVMNAAGERYVAACRCNCVLTHEKGLAIMQDLYDVQKSLVAVMNAPWGDIDLGGMRDFAALLSSYLDVATPGGNTALGPAITALNLKAALDAQNAINGLNVTWSGEVVTGNLDVKYQQSDRGLVLKIDDTTPFRYTYRVWNKTNRPLEIQLRAAFTDRPTWNAGVTIENFPGDPGTVSLQPFNASDPNNPAAFTDVVVTVTTPASGRVDETGNLRLTASVPSPVGVFNTDERVLTIGRDVVTEPTATVEVIGPIEVDGSPGAAEVGDDVVYTAHVRFHTTVDPQTRDFRAFVVYVSPSNASTLYFVGFNKAAETDTSLTNETQKVTRPYPLTNNVNDDLIVTIRPQAGSVGHALTFKIRVQSVLDSTMTVESQNFTINPVSS